MTSTGISRAFSRGSLCAGEHSIALLRCGMQPAAIGRIVRITTTFSLESTMAQLDMRGTEVPQDGFQIPAIRRVPATAAFRWLALGWNDLQATGFRGCFYGIVFACMGLLLSSVYQTHWQFTMGVTAGFFLMGPFICAGLYELSRQRARGEVVHLGDSLVCWKRNPGSIGFFAAILTFAMIVWARVSVVMFALFSTTDFPTMQGVIYSIFSLSNTEFLLAWGGVGFIFASLVFSISVISVPLMLDRRTDTMMAIFGSVRTLFVNTATVYLWAMLIVIIIGLSLALWFVPLVITAPLIGHATWHAYQDMMER